MPCCPSVFPVGYVPLCVGDFDFLPGSQHVIAAPPVQSGRTRGKTWVFTGFSNGLGQNAIYTADFNTSVRTRFTPTLSPAVPASVVTSPPGLTVNVDGQDDSKGSALLWGEGQTHHLIAPATQTDATGRPWKFVGWSNGGSADQNYTVPTGLLGLTLVATYAPVGKLQVVSVPSGLPFMVDGAPCTTPCVLRRQTHRSEGASGRTGFGNAGRLQPIHVRFLEWRKHRHFVPGHHWRSGAGFHRNLSGVL